jgi:hypothetical protein
LKLPVKVVSSKSRFAVPFATYEEAIEFMKEIAPECPDAVYHIEFETVEVGLS